VRQTLQAGYTTNITINATINGTLYSAMTRLIIQSADINININETIQNSVVGFTDVLEIDPTETYDPDYPGVQLDFIWNCPN
jgi:hypothetical protein